MAKTPEGKVKEVIKKFFATQLKKAWVYMPVPTGYGKRGVPDFIVCIPTTITSEMVGMTLGLFVAVEAKAEDKNPDHYQAMQLSLIEQAAGITLVQAGTELSARMQNLTRVYAHQGE